MDAKTKKILIYGAVALGAYLLYKKYSKKDETVVVVTDEEVMSEAAGRRRISTVQERLGVMCTCRGSFNGYALTHNGCTRRCRKDISDVLEQ